MVEETIDRVIADNVIGSPVEANIRKLSEYGPSGIFIKGIIERQFFYGPRTRYLVRFDRGVDWTTLECHLGEQIARGIVKDAEQWDSIDAKGHVTKMAFLWEDTYLDTERITTEDNLWTEFYVDLHKPFAFALYSGRIIQITDNWWYGAKAGPQVIIEQDEPIPIARLSYFEEQSPQEESRPISNVVKEELKRFPPIQWTELVKKFPDAKLFFWKGGPWLHPIRPRTKRYGEECRVENAEERRLAYECIEWEIKE